jgi:hypothetical protein
MSILININQADGYILYTGESAQRKKIPKNLTENRPNKSGNNFIKIKRIAYHQVEEAHIVALFGYLG